MGQSISLFYCSERSKLPKCDKCFLVLGSDYRLCINAVHKYHPQCVNKHYCDQCDINIATV